MFAPVLAAIVVSTAFEGGSLGRIESVTEIHWRLGSKGEKDQDGRNRQANWYYFRVDGARKGQALTFDMVDLPGEYNYKPNRGAITKDTPPVISADGKTWRHLETVEYDAGEPRLRLRVTAPGERFWIAHVPPYTNEDLAALRARAGKHTTFRHERIGKTLGGRDLELWTIGDERTAKHSVWLMFRQHSWESGSSWAGQGAVLTLLEDASLRKDVVWKILPLCDPDGVARGGVRFNAKGFDLNRNWDVRDPVNMPEITAQRGAIERWLKAGHKVDFFLSLHNTETGEYLEGPPDPAPAIRSLGDRLFAELTKNSTFHPSRPLSFAADSTTPGKPGRRTVNQALGREHGMPAFLMEQRVAYNDKLKRLPLPEDRLQFGGQLVRAIYRSVAVVPK